MDAPAQTVTLPITTATVPTLPVPTATTPTLPVPSLPTPTVSVPTLPLRLRRRRRRRAATADRAGAGDDVAAPDPSRTGAAAPAADDHHDTHRRLARSDRRDGNTARRAATAAPVRRPGELRALRPRPTARARRRERGRSRRGHTGLRDASASALAFVLPRRGPIFLVVRGPAPSCRVAGVIPVRGRKGENTVYFAGRVHGRRLAPGVYLISLSPNRHHTPGAATEYVRVVSARRSLPLPDGAKKPTCTNVTSVAMAATSPSLIGGTTPEQATAQPSAQVAGVAVPAPSGDENDDGAAGLPDPGVFGAVDGLRGRAPLPRGRRPHARRRPPHRDAGARDALPARQLESLAPARVSLGGVQVQLPVQARPLRWVAPTLYLAALSAYMWREGIPVGRERLLDLDRARPARALDGECGWLGTGRRPRVAAVRAPARGLRPPARACRRPALLHLVSAPARGRRFPLRRQRPDRLAPGSDLARIGQRALVRPCRLGRLRELLRGDLPRRRPALVLCPRPLSPLRRMRRAPRRDGIRHVRALPRGAALARERRWRARPDDAADRSDLRRRPLPLLLVRGAVRARLRVREPGRGGAVAARGLHAPDHAVPLALGASVGPAAPGCLSRWRWHSRSSTPPSTTSSTSSSAGRTR